jgi:hypothetical protein
MCGWPKRLFLLLLLAQLSLVALAGQKKVYSWRDENGVLVFSDSPKEGAKEVNISKQSAAMPATDTSILRQLSNTPDKLVKTTVNITQPLNQSTIRNTDGTVIIIGLAIPKLKNGYQLSLSLNGKRWGNPQRSGRFILRNIDRGEHQVVMHLTNAAAKTVASTKVVTFYVHRPSVNRP